LGEISSIEMKMWTALFLVSLALFQSAGVYADTEERPIRFAFYHNFEPGLLERMGGNTGLEKILHESVRKIEKKIAVKIQITRIEEFKPPLITEVWRDENSMTAYHNMALDYIPTEHSDFSFLIIDDPLYMQDGEAESIPGKKAVVKYSSTDTENKKFLTTLIHEWGHLLGRQHTTPEECRDAIQPIMCRGWGEAEEFFMEEEFKQAILCFSKKLECAEPEAL